MFEGGNQVLDIIVHHAISNEVADRIRCIVNDAGDKVGNVDYFDNTVRVNSFMDIILGSQVVDQIKVALGDNFVSSAFLDKKRVYPNSLDLGG